MISRIFMITLPKIHHILQNLFFPPICLGCKTPIIDKAFIMCVKCRHELPVTNFINESENLTEKIFYGRCIVENAASFLEYYKKGLVKNIIHALKYKKHEEVGAFLGKWVGVEMKKSMRFNDIDCVIAVPLHPIKKRKRGYNQVNLFAAEIATQLNTQYYKDILISKLHTKTLTKKGRKERANSGVNKFVLSNTALLENKHILLADDVITTGTTLELCIKALPKNTRVSIITMAITV